MEDPPNLRVSRLRKIRKTEDYEADLNLGDEIRKKFKSNSGFSFNKGLVISQLSNIQKNYSGEEKIGEGGYANVFSVIHNETFVERALKIFTKVQTDSTKESLNEVQLLKDLDHPNIIRIFEFAEDENNYYVITELIKGGSLYDILEAPNAKLFPEYLIKEIMEKVLMAINYAHSHRIVHRDIKSENVLIQFENKNEDDSADYFDDQNPEKQKVIIKLIDWGLSVQIQNDIPLQLDCGTTLFKAPQVFQLSYNEKCDIWSCGTLMYELITGQPPFDGNNDKEIEAKIMEGSFEITESMRERISPEGIQLLEAMMTYSEDLRPSASSALKFPWFSKTESTEIDTIKGIRKGLGRIRDFHADSFLLKFVLTFFAIHTMSDEENRELTSIFNAIDTNKDGKISKEEMASSLRLLYNKEEEPTSKSRGKQVSDDEISEIVSKLDFNNNGEIEYTEFLVGAMRKYTIQNDDFLRSVFDLFDSDGDGSITLIEVQQKLQTTLSESSSSEDVKKSQQQVWKSIISEVDQNGDQAVSFEEFRDIINRFFIKNDMTMSQFMKF